MKSSCDSFVQTLTFPRFYGYVPLSSCVRNFLTIQDLHSCFCPYQLIYQQVNNADNRLQEGSPLSRLKFQYRDKMTHDVECSERLKVMGNILNPGNDNSFFNLVKAKDTRVFVDKTVFIEKTNALLNTDGKLLAVTVPADSEKP